MIEELLLIETVLVIGIERYSHLSKRNDIHIYRKYFSVIDTSVDMNYYIRIYGYSTHPINGYVLRTCTLHMNIFT